MTSDELSEKRSEECRKEHTTFYDE